MANYKACPLLLQSDTNPSLIMEGEKHTRTYFLRCLGDECVAYKNGLCMWFDSIATKKDENAAEDTISYFDFYKDDIRALKQLEESMRKFTKEN